MSWLDDLSGELRARRVPRRVRHRILLELRDHIACEPGCEDRLGDPRELAVSFADELATSEARGSAFGTFAALAVAALVLIVSLITLGRFAHYPGYSNGISTLLFFPALLGMVVAPQVALVAGTLAAWRALRRRRVASLPADEIGLIHRRARVALAAGFATMAGLELYVVDFSERLPAWWLGLVGGLAAVAGVGLFAAARTLVRARAIVSGAQGQAGDIYDDLPRARMALAAQSSLAPRRARVARGRTRAGSVRGARRALGRRGHPARDVRGPRRRGRIRRPRPRDRCPAGASRRIALRVGAAATREHHDPAVVADRLAIRGTIDRRWDSPTLTTSPRTTSSSNAGSAGPCL